MHGASRALHVVRPDGLIDLPVRVGGVAHVAIDRAFRGRPPALVVERGDHLDERRDNRVARRGRDAAMEVDVVHEKHLTVGQRREQARDFVGKRGEMLRRRTLGGEARGADLENAARLEDIVAGELVERGEKTQSFDAERWRSVGDVSARAAPRADDAEGGERPQTRAHRRPADADVVGEVALRRQASAGLQAAVIDEVADVGDDRRGAVGRVVPLVPGRHNWIDRLYLSRSIRQQNQRSSSKVANVALPIVISRPELDRPLL